MPSTAQHMPSTAQHMPSTCPAGRARAAAGRRWRQRCSALPQSMHHHMHMDPNARSAASLMQPMFQSRACTTICNYHTGNSPGQTATDITHTRARVRCFAPVAAPSPTACCHDSTATAGPTLYQQPTREPQMADLTAWQHWAVARWSPSKPSPGPVHSAQCCQLHSQFSPLHP